MVEQRSRQSSSHNLYIKATSVTNNSRKGEHKVPIHTSHNHRKAVERHVAKLSLV